MALGNKKRFDVFKRDGFICQYCGGHPPDKILECDHVIPVSKGGTDDINNLVTSCFECNRGKRDHELGVIPSTLSENIEVMREKEKQYKAYRKLLDQQADRAQEEIDEVQEIFTETFPDQVFTDKFRIGSVKPFIAKLDINQVKEAMSIACSKGRDSHNTIKYFCGICWNKIKNTNG